MLISNSYLARMASYYLTARIRDRLGISFERFLERPDHYLAQASLLRRVVQIRRKLDRQANLIN